METSKAYLDYGRWIAECPEPGCTDARSVYTVDGTRQTSDVCANGHAFWVEMPAARLERQIVAALEKRPEAERRWYTEGDPRAAERGVKAGLTPEELAEHEEPERTGAQAVEDRRAQLEALGVEVAADGTFKGAL